MSTSANTSNSALVTGASSGIGLATAVHLARNGYRVFAGLRDLTKSGRLREATAGLPVEIVQLDVTDDQSVARAVAHATNVAPVDVLVNNAGIGRDNTTSDDVAAVVLQAIRSTSSRINWPAGKDANAIAEARHRVAMEEWVELGGDVPDAEYNAWFARNFEITL